MSDTPFQLRSSRIGDAVVLVVIGEIDMATSPDVARTIDGSPRDAERVVVDLTEVSFLDSSALNALVHCQRNLAENDIGFRIVSPSDHAVRSVFDITHLTGPLSVVDSLDDALAD